VDERDPISQPFCELRRAEGHPIAAPGKISRERDDPIRPGDCVDGMTGWPLLVPRQCCLHSSRSSRRSCCCRLTIPLAAYCRALSLHRPAQSVTRTIGRFWPFTLAQKTRHELQGHRGARKPIGILSKFSMMQSCPMSSAPLTPRHHRAHGHSVPVSPCIVAMVTMISWSVVEYPEARSNPCVGQRGSNGLRTSR
jgi:hypothetical protein